MNKRAIAPASLIAALALSGIAGGASAQEPADPADSAATANSTTGTIVAIVASDDADGRPGYFLELEDGTLIELSFGPSWFWGDLNPLSLLVGDDVTVGGQLRDGEPNENASDTAKERAAHAPGIKVRTVNGLKLRDQGKPPWAGGPKVVGEVHPGYDGWSKAQAAKAEKADKAAKPEKPAGGKPGQ